MKSIGRTKATVVNLVYQYASLLLAIVNGIVLVPLYLRFIDLELYGVWLATGDILSWLALLDPGLNELVRQQAARFYGEKNWKSLGHAIGTGWLAITALSLLTVLVGVPLSYIAPGWFPVDPRFLGELRWSVFLGAVGMALVFFAGSPGCVQQAFQRSDRYLIVYLAGWALGIATTVAMLFAGCGLVSIPVGGVVRGVIWAVGSGGDVFWSARRLGVAIRWHTPYLLAIRGLLGATLLKQAARLLATHCDALLVGLILGPKAVPVMVFTRRLWDMALNFGERISVAFVPGLAHLYGEGKTERFAEIAARVVRVTGWFVALETAVVLCLNRSFVGVWVGEPLFGGAVFSDLHALAVPAFVYASCLTQVLYAAGVIQGPAVAGIGQSVLRVAVLAAGLAPFGIVASPLSTVVSGIVLFYLTARLASVSGATRAELARAMLLPLVPAVLIGGLGGRFVVVESWRALLLAGPAVGIVCIAGLLVADSECRAFARAAVRRFLPARPGGPAA